MIGWRVDWDNVRDNGRRKKRGRFMAGGVKVGDGKLMMGMLLVDDFQGPAKVRESADVIPGGNCTQHRINLHWSQPLE